MFHIEKTLFILSITLFEVLLTSCNENPRPPKKVSLDSLANSHYNRAGNSYDKDNYRLAILDYKKAARHFENIPDSIKLSNAINNVGLCFFNLGIYDSSIYYYTKSMEINRRLQDTIRWAGRIRNVGLTYWSMGSFTKALEYYLDSKRIVDAYTKVDKRTIKNKGAINTAIGNIYLDQENYKSAMVYFKSALSQYIQTQDTGRVSIGYNNLGSAYFGLNQLDSAEFFYSQALKINLQLDNKSYEAFSRYNLGLINLKKGHIDKAEENLLHAYNIRSKIEDTRNLAISANKLAELYINRNDLLTAKPYLTEALSYAENQKNRTILMDNLELQSQYFFQMGKSDLAYQYLKNWSALRDSIFNIEKLKVQEHLSQYNLEKIEDEKLAEARRADAEKDRATYRMRIIWIILGFAFIILIFAILLYLQRKKIENLNSELHLVNRDMYHRKRNDYTRILNTLEKAGFPFIDPIRNMIFASTAVDESLYEEVAKKVDLKLYLNGLLKDLQEALMLNEKAIKLNISIKSIITKGENASKIAYIVSELITNSTKHSFRSTKGKIELEIKKDGENINILYLDNGEPFYQKNKNGIGNQLINSFLDMTGGSMKRSLESGRNVTHLSIPI